MSKKVDLSTKKTEAGWLKAVDDFVLRATPKWFEWLEWVTILGVILYFAYRTNSIPLKIVGGISIAAFSWYIQASGRLETIQEGDPIWTRHDRAGEPGGQLTSHAFVKNVKRYAEEAGIKSFHLHQLRHSFARIAGDESGSVSAVQEALGHKSPATTKVYLQRVGVRGDQFSSRIAERLGVSA